MVRGMSNPFQPDYRISDAERRQAMEDLGAHFAAGRLDMSTYEQRIDQVASATMRSEISYLFDDLPAAGLVAPTLASTSIAGEPTYTASEIDRVRREGQRTRAGILGVTTVGCFIALATGGSSVGAVMFLIPLVWLLLYVMKVGPDSWYMPSRAKLERERLRQVRMLEAQHTQAIRLAHAEQLAHQKALRQQRQNELASTAMEFADEALKKLRRRR